MVIGVATLVKPPGLLPAIAVVVVALVVVLLLLLLLLSPSGRCRLRAPWVGLLIEWLLGRLGHCVGRRSCVGVRGGGC
jgi:hypothetical protein